MTVSSKKECEFDEAFTASCLVYRETVLLERVLCHRCQ